MKHVMFVAVAVLAIAAGWALAAPDERPPAAPGGASTAPTAAPAAPVASAVPAAAPAPAAAPSAPAPAVVPPPPMPEVAIPPIPPVGEDPFRPGMPRAAGEPQLLTLQEDKRLFNREGRIAIDDDGRTVFVFDSGDPPMRLLENSLRQYLEGVTDLGKLYARWRVSGLITEYRGKNYLLLSKVVRVMPEEDAL